MNKIVKFNDMNTAYVTCHKWDYGQVLEFEDIPADSEVHFPVKNSAELAVVKVSDNKCDIPNSTLTLDVSSFDAYLYVDNGAAGRTKKTIHFTLNQRAKPEGHIYNTDADKVLSYKSLQEILSSGKLKGIELLLSVEDYYKKFEQKYADPETGETILADGEYVMFIVPEDVSEEDEFGEQFDLLKGIYVVTDEDGYVLAESNEQEFKTINETLSNHTKGIKTNSDSIANVVKALDDKADASSLETVKKALSVRTQLEKTTYLIQTLADGTYEIANLNPLEGGVTLKLGVSGVWRFQMRDGEMFTLSTENNVRSMTVFTHTGCWYVPDINDKGSWANYRYATYAEVLKELETKADKSDVLQLTAKVEKLENSWKLISDNTLSEAVSSVIIDKDLEDNAFSFRKVRVYMQIPKSDVSEYILVKKGNAVDGTTASAGMIVGLANSIYTSSARHFFAECALSTMGVTGIASVGNSQGIMTTTSRGFNPDAEEIDSLIIRTNNLTNVIPVGTQIKVWGC